MTASNGTVYLLLGFDFVLEGGADLTSDEAVGEKWVFRDYDCHMSLDLLIQVEEQLYSDVNVV